MVSSGSARPQLHGDDGQGDEQRQADLAHVGGRLVELLVPLAGLVHVQTDQDACQHAHDVDGHVQVRKDQLSDVEQELAEAAGDDQVEPRVLTLFAAEDVGDLLGDGLFLLLNVTLVQVVLLDDGAADGSADQASGDQAEGRGSDSNFDSADTAHFSRDRAEGGSVSVSAGQRGGACHQCGQGVHSHRGADAKGHSVLDHCQCSSQDGEDDDQPAALLQKAERSFHAGGGEEDVVEEVVHDRLVFPLELYDVTHVERAGDDGEDGAAHDCAGNAVFLQDRSLVADPLAEIDDKDDDRHHLKHFDLDCWNFHVFPPSFFPMHSVSVLHSVLFLMA